MSKDGEKIFNDIYNPIFLNPDSVSVWILIVDGDSVMRTESIHMMDDEEVKRLSDSGYEIHQQQNKLHNMLNKLLDDVDNNDEI